MIQHRPRPAMPVAGAEWGDLRRLPLWLALGFALLVMALAYQRPGGASVEIDVGAQGDRAYLSGFYAQERTRAVFRRARAVTATLCLLAMPRTQSHEAAREETPQRVTVLR